MLTGDEKILRRILHMHLSGTRGGPVRLNILLLLERKPHNINEIATKLSLDYKTIQHHIRVLHKSGFIIPAGRKYANSYSLAEIIRINKKLLKEINDMGKSK